MNELARGEFTQQQVIDALHGKHGTRKERYRYDLLDYKENRIKELTNVLSGEVSFAALNDIKRTAKFVIVDDGKINWLSDRIQPFFEMQMPGNKWISFPLGIFLLSSPTKVDTTGGIQRDVEAYDGTIILRDDRFENNFAVAKGTNVKLAVIDLLESAGITKYIIGDTDSVLTVTKEFEIGDSKLGAINALLTQINFTPIRVDVNGYFRADKYFIPSYRAVEYTYKDDHLSVMFNGITEEFDLFNTPNKWVVVRTNSEEPPLKSVYTNTNPNNPTSTVNRKRTITEKREIENISSQEALDAYAERVAYEDSRTFGKLVFSTAIMPMHDYHDMLKVEFSPLNIDDKYTETTWSFPLEVGGQMVHEVRKVVYI